MARVFVPQEPVKKDENGDMVRQFDLSSAAAFGDLIFICPSSKPPLDPEASLAKIRQSLETFGPDDYLLPVGSMRLIVWCAGVAGARVQHLKVLEWDGSSRRYVSTVADLGEIEPASC